MDQLEKAIQEHRERIAQCHHDNTVQIDDSIYCNDCESVIAVECWDCGGGGYVYEDEYECDWINNSHRLIVCPGCGGDGWQ